MNRKELTEYILETYNSVQDYPWEKYPGYTVFRHPDNKKWFALIMNISKSKLGMPDTEMVDVLNIKCDPELLGAFLAEDGFFPAYHMNKANWLTAALDGSVPDIELMLLVDISFRRTASKLKNKKQKQKDLPD